MTEFYVRWYDNYGCPYISKVYFVDSTRDRFLAVQNETGRFYWVDTRDCELVNKNGEEISNA